MKNQNKPSVADLLEAARLSKEEIRAITYDWDETNKRRLALIARIAANGIVSFNSQEKVELDYLQRLAGIKRELLSRPSVDQLRFIEANMRKKGTWK